MRLLVLRHGTELLFGFDWGSPMIVQSRRRVKKKRWNWESEEGKEEGRKGGKEERRNGDCLFFNPVHD